MGIVVAEAQQRGDVEQPRIEPPAAHQGHRVRRHDVQVAVDPLDAEDHAAPALAGLDQRRDLGAAAVGPQGDAVAGHQRDRRPARGGGISATSAGVVGLPAGRSLGHGQRGHHGQRAQGAPEPVAWSHEGPPHR
jgi:hypothetical protein